MSCIKHKWKLAFTRPKAGREVGPLNWTHEHKSVWYGPPSKATCHARRPARDWPMPLSYHRPARRRAPELGPQAIAQASVRRPWGLSRNGKILHRFPNFYTLRVEIFRMFFQNVCLWPLWTMKSFMEIGPHAIEKYGRQTHTQTDRRGSFIYIQTTTCKERTVHRETTGVTWSSGLPGSLLLSEPATTRTDLMARKPQS